MALPPKQKTYNRRVFTFQIFGINLNEAKKTAKDTCDDLRMKQGIYKTTVCGFTQDHLAYGEIKGLVSHATKAGSAQPVTFAISVEGDVNDTPLVDLGGFAKKYSTRFYNAENPAPPSSEHIYLLGIYNGEGQLCPL